MKIGFVSDQTHLVTGRCVHGGAGGAAQAAPVRSPPCHTPSLKAQSWVYMTATHLPTRPRKDTRTAFCRSAARKLCCHEGRTAMGPYHAITVWHQVHIAVSFQNWRVFFFDEKVRFHTPPDPVQPLRTWRNCALGAAQYARAD